MISSIKCISRTLNIARFGYPIALEKRDLRVLESTTLLGANGGGGISTAETTGIVVYNNVKITVDTIGSGATGKLQHILMRGYLVQI